MRSWTLKFFTRTKKSGYANAILRGGAFGFGEYDHKISFTIIFTPAAAAATTLFRSATPQWSGVRL
jgi:hypothetical protein